MCNIQSCLFHIYKNNGARELIDKPTEFISVHSILQEIISGNAKTLEAAAKFIEILRKSEELHKYLADREIIGVERGAYHSGAFNGNMTKKILESYGIVIQPIVNVAELHNTYQQVFKILNQLCPLIYATKFR